MEPFTNQDHIEQLQRQIDFMIWSAAGIHNPSPSTLVSVETNIQSLKQKQLDLYEGTKNGDNK